MIRTTFLISCMSSFAVALVGRDLTFDAQWHQDGRFLVPGVIENTIFGAVDMSHSMISTEPPVIIDWNPSGSMFLLIDRNGTRHAIDQTLIPELFATEPGIVGRTSFYPSSDFGSRLSGVLITPTNDNSHLFVVNPTDEYAVTFCLDGEFQWVPMQDDPTDAIEVEASVSVLLNGQEDYVEQVSNYILSISDTTYISGDVLEYLNEAVSEHGCSADVLHLLPTLRFNLATTELILLPQDWVREDPVEECLFLVTETMDPDILYIGHEMLRNIAFRFDYENNQVGFCEPQ